MKISDSDEIPKRFAEYPLKQSKAKTKATLQGGFAFF